jgi:hypothetical protein
MAKIKRQNAGLILGLIAAVALVGCQTAGGGWRGQKPLLYPNAHLKQVGQAAAQGDIAQCEYLAQSGPTQRSTGKDAAVNTLGGAAAGAALGAIGGAIAGNAGTGAAAGAAVGGTLGIAKTAYDTSKPTENFKGYVDACLREKGYEVIGWQ